MSWIEFYTLLIGIIGVDLLLSGDNAVVIALVCRNLPDRQRNMGIALGAGAAVLLRIALSFVIAWLIAIPGLRLAGGAFLLYVAVGLLKQEEDNDANEGRHATSLLKAVWLVAVADVSMSVDNVIALAALSHGNQALMAIGVLLSIPLVIVGAAVIAKVVDRFPLLVWAGAALLGWVAGGIIATDPFLLKYVTSMDHNTLGYVLSAVGTLVVLAVGWAMLDGHAEDEEDVSGTA